MAIKGVSDRDVVLGILVGAGLTLVLNVLVYTLPLSSKKVNSLLVVFVVPFAVAFLGMIFGIFGGED